jgi:hypothetical protein
MLRITYLSMFYFQPALQSLYETYGDFKGALFLTYFILFS